MLSVSHAVTTSASRSYVFVPKIRNASLAAGSFRCKRSGPLSHDRNDGSADGIVTYSADCDS
jgi:hypothetical protein